MWKLEWQIHRRCLEGVEILRNFGTWHWVTHQNTTLVYTSWRMERESWMFWTGVGRCLLLLSPYLSFQVPCLRFTSVKPKQTLDGCTVPAIEAWHVRVPHGFPKFSEFCIMVYGRFIYRWDMIGHDQTWWDASVARVLPFFCLDNGQVRDENTGCWSAYKKANCHWNWRNS